MAAKRHTMTNHIAHALAARVGLRVEVIECYLRDGLTPEEIIACAGINAAQKYVDAFDLATRHKARIELRGTPSRPVSEFVLPDGSTVIVEHDQPGDIALTYNDPGGPIERDADGQWILYDPWTEPHTGTTRRTKRHTAPGTMS
jgi:hypothetical protein